MTDERKGLPLKKPSKRLSTRQMALSSLLLALMLVLGYIESLLPSFSVPGIKIGLSNSLLLFAIYMLGVPHAFLLMVLKVTLSSLLFGGFSAFLYAMAGGLLSMALMSALHAIGGLSPITVSMAGGVSHNVGQVLVAMLILHTDQLVYYMAVLMVAGLVCGALTGVCALNVMRHMKHIPGKQDA